MANYVSDRRWYLNADQSEAVEEGDETAATLLVGEGGEVPAEVAAQYDLAKKAKANPVAEPAAEEAPAEDAPAQPPETKAQQPQENKAQPPPPPARRS